MDIVAYALSKKYTNKSIASAMIGAKSITQEDDKIKVVTFDDAVFYLDIDGLFTDAEREKLDRFSKELSRIDIDANGNITVDGEAIKVNGSGGTTTKDITATVACGAVPVGKKVPTGTDLQKALEMLLVKDESPATVLTLTLSDGKTFDTIREKGVPVNITAKAVVTKKSYDISKVEWTSGIIATESGVSASGGTFTRTLNNISSDVTITCKATDIKKLVGTGSKSLSYVNPIYMSYIDKDIDNSTITEDMITGGNKILKKKATFTSDKIILDKQKLCIAYDSSYGVLKSIKDVNNGFENIDSFIKSELDITTAGGTVVKYYIYLMQSPSILEEADNFKYQIVW